MIEAIPFWAGITGLFLAVIFALYRPRRGREAILVSVTALLLALVLAVFFYAKCQEAQRRGTDEVARSYLQAVRDSFRKGLSRALVDISSVLVQRESDRWGSELRHFLDEFFEA
jgi:O-antigen/teichoic acid export membrane protein